MSQTGDTGPSSMTQLRQQAFCIGAKENRIPCLEFGLRISGRFDSGCLKTQHCRLRRPCCVSKSSEFRLRTSEDRELQRHNRKALNQSKLDKRVRGTRVPNCSTEQPQEPNRSKQPQIDATSAFVRLELDTEQQHKRVQELNSKQTEQGSSLEHN